MLQFTFSAARNGTIRTYYVGAVEEDWDYMPTGIDLINRVEIDQSPQAATVAIHNGQRIGHVYTKAMFREFTDDTFAVQAKRPQVRLATFVDFPIELPGKMTSPSG
ncbi:hypothetical protein AtubIFM55763_001112 [Aspergillus tubingensis]|nr:hypothetical protein AtubIFM55763_001112 [Aspergillus tubingensis]